MVSHPVWHGELDLMLQSWKVFIPKTDPCQWLSKSGQRFQIQLRPKLGLLNFYNRQTDRLRTLHNRTEWDRKRQNWPNKITKEHRVKKEKLKKNSTKIHWNLYDLILMNCKKFLEPIGFTLWLWNPNCSKVEVHLWIWMFFIKLAHIFQGTSPAAFMQHI